MNRDFMKADIFKGIWNNFHLRKNKIYVIIFCNF